MWTATGFFGESVLSRRGIPAKLATMCDKPGAGDRDAGHGSEPGAGPERVPDGPDAEIVELSAACRQYVGSAFGIELDFSPETLPLLDHYVKGARADVAGRPQLLPLMARVVGAYFGEVARRHLGLFWYLPSADAHTWQVCGRSAFLSISPIGVAYDALTASGDHSGPSSQLRLSPEERDFVQRRLDSLPEVSDEEYYLLSTRLEILEIAADALRAQMQAAGCGDVEFDLRDYLPDPWAD